MFENADAIIVLSTMEKEMLTNRYGALNFHVLPNAVNTSFHPAHLESIKKGKLKLVFVGRINASKGIHVISDAFKYLADYMDRFTFEIFGAGPDLDSWVTSLKCYPGLNFAYKGIVGGKDKWQALCNADIFLLPSIHSEGMPISILEAMAVGCVVIVTDDASITSVVTNNQTGLVISKNKPQQLALKIKQLIDGDIDSLAISRQAKEYISQHLSIPGYIKSLEDLYSTLN
jgi:glycosyltransferase involved in cell wall biosynthesis